MHLDIHLSLSASLGVVVVQVWVHVIPSFHLLLFSPSQVPCSRALHVPVPSWVLSSAAGQMEFTLACTEACLYYMYVLYGKVWREEGEWGWGVNVGRHKARITELLVECHGKMRQRNADSTEQCKQAGLRECCHAALKSLHS